MARDTCRIRSLLPFSRFLADGLAASLVQYAKHARYPVDLQMRHNPKASADHASLYIGLTSVLNVRAKGSNLALDAHETWRNGPSWFAPVSGHRSPLGLPLESRVSSPE